MSAGEFTLEAVISARDEASGSLSAIGDSFGSLRKDINSTNTVLADNTDAQKLNNAAINDAIKKNRMVNRAFDVQHNLLGDGIKVMSGFGNAAVKVNGILLTYNTIQHRIEDQEERVSDARDKSAEALAKYGRGSKQHVEALKKEQKAQDKLNQINQEAIGQYLSMGVAVTSLGADAFRIAKDVNAFNHTLRDSGGLRGVLKLGGRGATSLAESALPLAGAGVGASGLAAKAGGLGGILSKLGAGAAGIGGGILQGLGTVFGVSALGDMAIKAGGYKGDLTLSELSRRNMSELFGSVGGEQGETLVNALAGKGAVSDAQLAAAGNGSMVVQGDVNIYPQGASSREVMDQVKGYVTVGSRIAGGG